MGDYTRDQLLIIVTFVVVNFCNALCASMQAPFYPREAVSKGLKVWHFGLVFGAFELTVFAVSPLIGTFLKKLGVKKTLNIGISLVGTVLIFYGMLGQLKSGSWFLGLSFFLRMIEACGNSAFLTGSFSAIAKEFPDKVASMFALLELFFGIGMIVGPMIGGALYQVGGFTLPFAIMGSLLVLASIFIFFVLPDIGNKSSASDEDDAEKATVKQALVKPSILIALYSVLVGAASIGFLQTTLEPHLGDAPAIYLSSFQVGSLFMVMGGSYGISLPVWGTLCDAKWCDVKVIELVGAFLVSFGFLVIGPLPLLPFEKTLVTVIIGMALHGFGLGASVVGGFADAHKSALACGFPDTIDTYGLISGLWTSVFAFGAFLGPVVGGALYSSVTFDWAILMIIFMEIVSIILLFSFLMVSLCRASSTLEEVEHVKTSSQDYGAIQREETQQRKKSSTRKYSECVSSSLVASSMARSMARSMSVSSPNGFINAGFKANFGEQSQRNRDEYEPLII